jgi:hypothetical protein
MVLSLFNSPFLCTYVGSRSSASEICSKFRFPMIRRVALERTVIYCFLPDLAIPCRLSAASLTRDVLIASYQKLGIWLISARVSDAAHHLTHVRGRNPRGRPARALQQNLSDLRPGHLTEDVQYSNSGTPNFGCQYKQSRPRDHLFRESISSKDRSDRAYFLASLPIFLGLLS